MTSQAWTQLVAFLAVLLVVAWPMGRWLHAVAEGRLPRWLSPLRKLENALYRLAGVDGDASMGWKHYALGILAFNVLGVVVVYALQRLQGVLPLNPQGMAGVSPDSSFNTAFSFVTNTNWQGYGGEATLSYLTQMLALTVQNFFSAATGIAVVYALIRGFVARSSGVIGNVWADLTRVTLYVLLPLSLVFAVFLVGQGVIQNFDAYKDVTTLEAAHQQIAMGPVASQEAIKMLGTNGGGFFNANSAHPYENPTPLSNFVQMLSILLIPAGLVFAFGRMVGDMRQGWAVLAAMTLLFVVSVVIVTPPEQGGNPQLTALGVDPAPSALQPGGNMEGKEARFGINATTLFAAITTAASCGAVNGMHDSFMPIGGAVPMVLIQLGEVVFGGVGSGLYGMLIFAILATPILVLVGTAVALVADAGKAGIANPGAHGFSEILYAFSSAANNNGSAFAGLSANTPFYNALLAVAVWFGRFAVIVPVLAIAGNLAMKKRLPVTAGTLPTHGALFVVLLIGTVLLVGLLNYVPALALGPVVEHLVLWK